MLHSCTQSPAWIEGFSCKAKGNSPLHANVRGTGERKEDGETALLPQQPGAIGKACSGKTSSWGRVVSLMQSLHLCQQLLEVFV